MDNAMRQYEVSQILRARRRIWLQYILTVLGSLFVGGLFVAFLSDESLPRIFYQAAVHFELVFYGIPSFLHGCCMVLRYAFPDLICGGLCFLFAFSPFHCWVSDLILTMEGISVGFSVWLLFQIERSRTPAFANGGYLLAFLLYKLSILTVCVVACSQSSLIVTNRQSLSSRRFYRRLLLLWTVFGGTVVLFTGIYALALYVLF